MSEGIKSITSVRDTIENAVCKVAIIREAVRDNSQLDADFKHGLYLTASEIETVLKESLNFLEKQ